MRGWWSGKRIWSALVLIVAGCWTTEPNLKPPPHPEECVVPPENDPRFSSPVAYPKEAQRDQQLKKATTTDPNNPAGSPSRFGAGGPGGRGY